MWRKIKELRGNGGSTKLDGEQVSTLERKTEFSAEEIRKSHRRFVGKHPDGKITASDLKKIYEQLCPSGGDASQFADFVFKTYDSNGDGFVDFQEFITALSLTKRGSLMKRLYWIFNIYDVDNNGYITRGEYLQVLKSICKMGPCIPGVGRMSPQKRVDQIFKQMDRNKDGYLSLNEFVEGVRRNPELEVLLNNMGEVNAHIHRF